jgi:hypothetical protein
LNSRLLRVCAALPVCVVAIVGLWSFLANNDGGWVWAPDEVTMSEAVATGDYAEVMRQLERGADPNPPADVRARLLSSKPSRVTPLQAAVWARNPVMLKMLMERGAVITPNTLAVLKCMNDENGNRDVRALLDAVAAESTLSCAQVTIPR